MTPIGEREVFDLTVDEVNHYITVGPINRNSVVCFDELVSFDKEQYDQISGRVRSSDPVLRAMLKIRSMSNPMYLRTTNENISVKDPNWVRRYFVDPAPLGKVILKKKITRRDLSVDYITRIYLPATLYDNPNKQFVKDYEATLLAKPPHIRQALLFGDWYLSVGAFYSEDWNPQIHVCRPFKIPDDWPQFRSMDWGHKTYGCVLWFAMDPDGNLYCHREMTFKGKMDKEVALRIAEIEKDLGVWRGKRSGIIGPADTQLWEKRGDSGRSKAENMAEMGVVWIPADKKSRAHNAERFCARLRDHGRGTTLPGIMFFENCKMTLQTIPGIQADPSDPEYPLEGGDDHWHDAVLYACAFASHGRKGIPRQKPTYEYDEDDDDHWEDFDRGRDGYGSMY
jgi:hypothetical protein